MTLAPFEVEGGPQRALVRWLPDGSERYVHVRVDPELLRAAVALPLVRVVSRPRDGDLLADGLLLTPQGSIRLAELHERICEDVEALRVAARFVAFESGHGGRDSYFVAEDAEAFEAVARAAADALGHEVTLTHHTLAEVGTLLLPVELAGDLGIAPPPDQRTRRTRFEFWGATDSLERLRDELQKRGYEFLEIERAARELRVAKVVPLDGAGFATVLREIVPLSRSLRCSYRGTETTGGFEQFALDRPLPERYAAPAAGGFWKRLFS